LNFYEPNYINEKEKEKVDKLKNKAIELDDDFDSMISSNNNPKRYYDKPKQNKQTENTDEKNYNKNYEEKDNGIEENLSRNKKILGEDKLSIHEIYNKNVNRLKFLDSLLDTNFSFKSKSLKVKSDPEFENTFGRKDVPVMSKQSTLKSIANSNYSDKKDENYFREEFKRSSKQFDTFITRLNNIKAKNYGDDFDY